MSGSLESRFVFGFSFHRAFLLLLLGSRRMLFSTGFLFALLVSLSEARCRLGFSRRIDAAIYRPAWKAKTRSQSSEHGVVATREHRHSSGSFWVKGDVTLLRGPGLGGFWPASRNSRLYSEKIRFF